MMKFKSLTGTSSHSCTTMIEKIARRFARLKITSKVGKTSQTFEVSNLRCIIAKNDLRLSGLSRSICSPIL